MINGAHFVNGYNFPSTAFYTVYDQRITSSNDAFFLQSIKQTIESDPTFANPIVTGNRFLGQLNDFLDCGGKPTLSIPEIRIGKTCCLRNISCLEFVYRLSICDFEDFFVPWDNKGVEICRDFKFVIDRCLEEVDKLTEDPHLNIEEIACLIQSVHASDPFLATAAETGNRILKLMEKFLANNGNPISSILNVRINNERLDITILELVYSLWKLPHKTEVEEWDDEDELIIARFEAIAKHFMHTDYQSNA